MKRLLVYAAFAAASTVGAVNFSNADEAPQKALGITDPHVSNYAVRARVSGRMFDRVKFAARDMLAKFSEPQSTIRSNFESSPGGFNAILDAGYDAKTHSGGGVRTTPVSLMWSWRSDIQNAGTCVPVGSASCAAINKDLAKSFHWLQSRRPAAAGTACNRDDIVAVNSCGNAKDGAANLGGILCNQRGVPAYWQNAQKEHGFFVAPDGQCFTAQNVCMSNAGLPGRPDGRNPGGYCFADVCTPHQYNELGNVCDMAAQWGGNEAQEVYMNVGVFIFPNGFVENAASGGVAWNRPRTLHLTADGDYFGYTPARRFGVYTGRGGNIGTLAPTSHPLRTSGADGSFTWKASGYPTGAANYNEQNPYDELFGSYFRAGDDIAFYADVRQMQIHSIDRDGVSTAAYGANAVAGCGWGPVYTGQVDATTNEPIYFNARVPQCLRPKSYWSAAKQKWVACNPYDTFLEDGVTLNPARDDNNAIYPGGSYPVGTQTTCGAQVSGQPLSPFTSTPPQGTGWSALRLNTLNLDTAGNKVDFAIMGEEWRMEMVMLFDFATECTVSVPYISTSPSCGGRPGYQAKRKWATGSLMLKDLSLSGTAKLYAVDSMSCQSTNGGCPDGNKPWGPADDGMTRPDKVYIDLALNTPVINLHPDPDPGVSGFNAYGQNRNMYRAVYQDLSNDGYSCYAEVYSNCAFTLAKGTAGSQANPQLLVPQITAALKSEFQNQFAKLINDLVDELNAGIPNLPTLLGDPWNFGNVLIDVSLNLAGATGDSQLDAQSRKIWPVRFVAPPAGRKEVIDVSASLGFRPIAFRPANNNGVMVVDTTPDVDKTPASVYGVPTLVYPDTAACFVTIKGTGAQGANSSTGAANTWINNGTAFTYNNTTGWITGTGSTINGLNFGRFFFQRANWKFSRIVNVHKGGMTPADAYQIEPGRSAEFPTGNWGVSDGWIVLNTTFTQGAFASIRAGDTFYFDASPNNKYTIKAVGPAANRTIQIDLLAGYANRTVAFPLSGAAAYTIVSRRCSDTSKFPQTITDNAYDYKDYLLEAFNWTDPKTGKSYNALAQRQVIEPYFMEPFTAAPSWCMSPKKVKQELDAINTLFPMTTWLSFHSTDLKPAGATSMANPSPWARHTLADWDSIPGAGYNARGIVRQNQNDPGLKEATATDFDASIHIHQRALNQLAMAVVGSGTACLEFSDTDPDTGETTPWADFLTTDRFAAVFPEIHSKWPGAKVKLRLSPQAAPRIRMGVGSLTHNPKASFGSANITAEPYTVAAALPNLQVQLVVVDPKTNVDISVFKMNWNAVVGVYLRAMRTCHPSADPDRLLPKCGTDPLLRTVTGYWQLYVDYGNPALAAQFEPPANTIDGFTAGQFTRSELVCTDPAKCKAVVNPGASKFEVLESCGAGCSPIGVAQALLTVLDSSISLYADTRASTDFLQIPFAADILYIGPDGPNDDGLGASTFGSRGDYLGIYLRQFGKLDLEGLMGSLSFAPKVLPAAVLPSLEGSKYVGSASPRLDVAMRGAEAPEGEFTYRVDGGFWRTPRADAQVELEGLTEGKHVLEVRSLVATDFGAMTQPAPTRYEFVVDTLAPAVEIPPSKRGTYARAVPVKVADIQTPRESLAAEYSLDDGPWTELEQDAVSLQGVKEGRHTLRVRATDLAGNTGEAAREIVVGEGAGCGGCSSSGATAELLVLAGLVLLATRALSRRRLGTRA